MEYRTFGNTGMSVSAVGFGAWGIGGPAMAGTTPIGWGTVDDSVSLNALRAAFDRGITFYDTADVYGFGHSEELIGSVFGNSPNVVIASKAGHRRASDGTLVLDYSKEYILSACEQSLKRLRRSAIDYFQLHSAKKHHLEHGGCIEACEQLKQEGKIRHWGVSLNTFHPEPEGDYILEHRLGAGIQVVFNIINQRALSLIQRASEQGFGIIARMPLQFGLLTGKFSRQTVFNPDDHRSFRLSPEIIHEAETALEEVWAVAEARGISKAQLALSYCHSVPGISTIIPGIKTPEQAIDNSTNINRLPGEVTELLQSLYDERFSALVEKLETRG